MKLRFIFPYYFIVAGAFSSILPVDFYPKTRATKDAKMTAAIRKIVNIWATHDIVIIAHNDTYDRNIEQVVNTIAKTSASSHPTQLFQTSNLRENRLDYYATATSRTLLFYAFRAEKTNRDMGSIVQFFNRASHKKQSPKIVLVMVTDKRGVRVTSRLKTMFNVGYSTVVGLEVSVLKDGRMLPSHVHRYDSVTTNSSRLSYDGDVSNWYTDKYLDLMGLPLRVCYVNSNVSAYDKFLELQLDVFREKMNATFILTPESERHCVMTFQSYYMLHNNGYLVSNDYSAPMYIDRLCLFIPNIVRKGSVTLTSGLSIAFVLGILIVAFIAGFSILARIGSFNHPFSIIAVILGASVDSIRLTSVTEKILYLCLVQVATRYMTIFYTELFSETALGQKPVKINDFEDLYGLDLKIKMPTVVYVFFMNSTDDLIPPKLEPMFELITNTEGGRAYEGNVGYFSMHFLDMYENYLRKTWPQKKMSNLCLGSVAIVQVMPARLWCKERMNDLLLRINQYGFREHANEWNYKWVGGRSEQPEEEIEYDDSSAQKMVVTALLYGYLLVVAVFLGELLVEWIRSRKTVNRVWEISY